MTDTLFGILVTVALAGLIAWIIEAKHRRREHDQRIGDRNDKA